jgi:hypothetical protein
MPDPTSDAREAMQAYLVAANEASNGRDFEGFRSSFKASCALCLGQYRNFRAAYEAGQRAEGDLYRAWAIDVQSLEGDRAIVVTKLDTGDIVLFDRDGTELERFPGEVGISTVWTLRKEPGDRWVVVGAQDLP